MVEEVMVEEMMLEEVMMSWVQKTGGLSDTSDSLSVLSGRRDSLWQWRAR